MLIFPRCCAASLCRVDVIFKRKRLGFRILARLGQPTRRRHIIRPWSRLVSNAPALDWQLYESYVWVAIHTSEDAYETTVQRTRNRHGCGDAGHPGGGMY